MLNLLTRMHDCCWRALARRAGLINVVAMSALGPGLLLGCADDDKPCPLQNEIPDAEPVDPRLICGPIYSNPSVAIEGSSPLFEHVQLGQGVQDATPVGSTYVDFSSPVVLAGVSNELLEEPQSEADLRSLFRRTLHQSNDAQTLSALGMIDAFASSVGRTADSFGWLDYAQVSWGPIDVSGELTLTEAGSAALNADQAIEGHREFFVASIRPGAFYATGMRLSFDGDASCKTQFIRGFLDQTGPQDLEALLKTDATTRKEIEKFLVAFSAHIEVGAVISNQDAFYEWFNLAGDYACHPSNLEGCAALVERFKQTREQVLATASDVTQSVDALSERYDDIISARDAEYTILGHEIGRLDGVAATP